MISVLIAEDEPHTQAHLAALLERSDGLTCVGTCERAGEVPDALARLAPDVLLLDLNLRDRDAVDSIAQFVERSPRTRIMVLSTLADEDHVVRALRAGAKGYILKGGDDALLVQEIRTLHLGGSPLTSSLAQKLIALLATPPTEERCPLTERQQNVLRMLALGFQYKDIADELHISPETVRTHIRNIYDALEVSSKREAIERGRRWGIFPR